MLATAATAAFRIDALSAPTGGRVALARRLPTSPRLVVRSLQHLLDLLPPVFRLGFPRLAQQVARRATRHQRGWAAARQDDPRFLAGSAIDLYAQAFLT